MVELLPLLVLALPALAVLALGVRAIEPAWLIATGVALTCFSGQWRYMGLPSNADRLLIAVGVAALLVREWRRDRLRALPLHPVHLVLAALSVYVLCSAVWSDEIRGEPLFALLDKFGLVPFVLFTVAPLAFRTPRQRHAFLCVFVVLGAYLGLTALCEGLGLRALVFPRYIADPAVGINFGRARGPFVSTDANGLALFACAVAALIGFTTWRDTRARVATLLIAGACLAGVVLTVTRQVWLACAVASVLTLALTPDLRRYLVPSVVGGAVLVAVLVLLVPGFAGRAQSRLQDRSPLWDRYNSNSAALRMIDERPALGFGWYRFEEASLARLRLAHDYPLTTVARPHNVTLSNAAELGVVATAVWLGTLLWLWLRAGFGPDDPALRRWRPGIFAVVTSWLVVSNFTPLSNPFANYLLWIWLGLGATAWMGWRRVASPAPAPAPAPAPVAGPAGAASAPVPA